MTVWQIMTPEEVAESDAYLAQEAKKRPTPFQCLCGRFVKASTLWRGGLEISGVRSWGWHCSQCGDVVERS